MVHMRRWHLLRPSPRRHILSRHFGHRRMSAGRNCHGVSAFIKRRNGEQSHHKQPAQGQRPEDKRAEHLHVLKVGLTRHKGKRQGSPRYIVRNWNCPLDLDMMGSPIFRSWRFAERSERAEPSEGPQPSERNDHA